MGRSTTSIRLDDDLRTQLSATAAAEATTVVKASNDSYARGSPLRSTRESCSSRDPRADVRHSPAVPTSGRSWLHSATCPGPKPSA